MEIPDVHLIETIVQVREREFTLTKREEEVKAKEERVRMSEEKVSKKFDGTEQRSSLE